jgi:glycine cleavage system aminomethyltransferase T
LLSGETLGLGRVDRDFAAAGTELNADVQGSVVRATIVRHPVYDPERRRAKEL